MADPKRLSSPSTEKITYSVEPHQIVYADDTQVVCWLWNHKDAQATCITDQTRQALFCIDAVQTPKTASMDAALTQLQENLSQIGGTTLMRGSFL